MATPNVKRTICHSWKGLQKVKCPSWYVDDIIIIGDFIEEIGGLKKTLAKEFEIKDLGNF